MFGKFDLAAGQDRQRVEQVEDGFGLGHSGPADEFQHHALGGLPAEWHGNQLSRANLPFQSWGQAIVKNARDRWNIDSNFGKGGHIIKYCYWVVFLQNSASALAM